MKSQRNQFERLRTPRHAALHYARSGWPVHPLRVNKKPFFDEWPTLASTDPMVIEDWWTAYADALVGIVTGQRPRMFVLDVDNKNKRHGDSTLVALEAQLGPLPQTYTVRTPHGRHFYFRAPDFSLRNSVDKLGSGIDIRSDGGYVVAPPSRTKDGGQYRVLNGCALAELPQSWLELLQAETGEARQARKSLDVIPQGQRNDTLFREACRLRRWATPQAEAFKRLQALNATCSRPPLSAREVRRLLTSAWRYRPSYPVSQLGNAQRFIEIYGHDVRYVVERRTFIAWNGIRWEYDTDHLKCLALMKDANRLIFNEARDAADKAHREVLTAWALSSQSTFHLKASLESVKSEPGVTISIHKLDADPMLLGVQNGVLELKTGTFRASRREDFISKSAGCEYVADAKAPQWLAFLARVTAENAALMQYLQCVMGYTLTGSTVEQILFFLYGLGANGKTVLLETVRALMSDYAITARTDALMARGGKGAASEAEARLKGARFVQCNETAEGMRFDEALLKELTGGDRIAARRLYENSFEFMPEFKLFIRGNYKPALRGDDIGIARRLKLIPFLVYIRKRDRDRHLLEKLKGELPGILNWAIKGCLRWQREGLHEPSVVRSATREYLREMDSFGQFLDESCQLDPACSEKSATLEATYRAWCTTHGSQPMGWSEAAQKLKARGCKECRGRFGGKRLSRGWRGIHVRTPAKESLGSS